jgi:hypothetical protein
MSVTPGRERTAAYLERRRYGRVLVSIEVEPQQLVALERLALLEIGARDKSSIANAVAQFLNAASHVSAMGDALWPADEGES